MLQCRAALFLLTLTAIPITANAFIYSTGPAESIQATIDSATHGDTIILLPGRYRQTLDFKGKAITLQSSDPADPEIVANTILEETDFQGETAYGATIFFTSRERLDSVLAGVTIVGGTEVHSNQATIKVESASPTLRNCVVTQTRSPALRGIHASPRIESCTFTKCRGGVFYFSDDSSPSVAFTLISETIFDYRLPHYSSVCQFEGGKPTLLRTTILRNVDGSGAPLSVRDGATLFMTECVVAENDNGINCYFADISISRSKIFMNECGDNEAGLAMYSGKATISDSTWEANNAHGRIPTGAIAVVGSIVSIDACTFLNNVAYRAGISALSTKLSVSNSRFTGNIGDSISLHHSQGTISNCLFTDNSGPLLVGGENSDATMTNCTLWGNETQLGSIQTDVGDVTLVNCILWNRGLEVGSYHGRYDTNALPPSFSHCIIRGGAPGPGNMNTPPVFINPEGGDFRQVNGSPGIDRGSSLHSTLTDINGRVRGEVDGFVDIGAHESPPEFTPTLDEYIPRRWYVDGNTTNSGDGMTWTTAFKQISNAVDLSGPSDEVWVTGGTYQEGVATGEYMRLLGGFTGQEDSPLQRVPGIVTHVDVASRERYPGHVCAVTLNKGSRIERFLVTGGWGGGDGINVVGPRVGIHDCIVRGLYRDGILLIRAEAEIIRTTIFESGSSGIRIVDGTATASDCLIQGNRGSGIVVTNGQMELVRCSILENYEWRGYGYGLSISWGSNAVIRNCVLSRNHGVASEGVIYCDNDSRLELLNSTLVGNTTDHGFYLPITYFAGVLIEGTTGSSIENCILSNQGEEIEVGYSPGMLRVVYSCIEGSWSGEGNIALEPGFMDLEHGDYRLAAGSPCIDAGNPDTLHNDACLPPGLGSSRNDMGAFGGPLNCGTFHLFPSPTPTETTSPTPTPTLGGDVNGDSRVDANDLLEQIRNWRGKNGRALPNDTPVEAGSVGGGLLEFQQYWQRKSGPQ